ncbi:uncharacterized protein LOC108029966 [Drosophila biarmipes]|uniref:uncharacterized protein LOC108029966 n=1 Tax=Drosophila biarmipes TaxID=125945 RepID=UPI001CDA89C6|nr:uncharacterized protein LOC108029966 [Drosophila biarmipes]
MGQKSLNKMADCRAPGILNLNLEEESDLLTSGKDPSGLEEETDLEMAYEELEGMKQRLILLRSQILSPKPDRCQDMKVQEDFRPERLQLQELRRRKCELICRFQEADRHLKDVRLELQELDDWRCLLQSRILQIKRQLAQFENFRPRVIHQLGLCLERWEHQKTHKMDCAVFRKEMEAQVHSSDNSRKSVVSLKCHQRHRQQIRQELAMLRVFVHNLFEAMISDFQFFCRQLSINFTRDSRGIDTSPRCPETPSNSVCSLDPEGRE